LVREIFTFDSAANIQASGTKQHESIASRVPLPTCRIPAQGICQRQLPDDECGNLVVRVQNEKPSKFARNAFSRTSGATAR
jgi:hypothetical protein